MVSPTPSNFPGKPGPSNTGPITPESQLTPYTGSYTITQDGTVLEGYKFTWGLTIKANNVIIRDFVIDGGDAYGSATFYGIKAIDGGENILIEMEK